MLKVNCDGNLYRWLSDKERKTHLLLADLYPDKQGDMFRLYIDVVFNAPIILRGTFKPRSFYVAASGARAILTIQDGELSEPYTKAITISAKYSQEHVETQNESVNSKRYFNG